MFVLQTPTDVIEANAGFLTAKLGKTEPRQVRFLLSCLGMALGGIETTILKRARLDSLLRIKLPPAFVIEHSLSEAEDRLGFAVHNRNLFYLAFVSSVYER